MISSVQALLARTMLRLSQKEAAAALDMAHTTLSNIENGESDPPASRMTSIQKFYENLGVEFLPGDGVRKKQVQVKTYNDADGFRDFMDHVYEVAKDQGGEICLYNAKPANWIKWLGKEWNQMHSDRMAELVDKIDFKATARKGDVELIGYRHAEYRWVPDELWSQQSFYAYGDNLAFLIFSEDAVSIFVITEKQIADGYRIMFSNFWENIAQIPDTKNYKPSKNKE